MVAWFTFLKCAIDLRIMGEEYGLSADESYYWVIFILYLGDITLTKRF
jgi:hypothetical protein